MLSSRRRVVVKTSRRHTLLLDSRALLLKRYADLQWPGSRRRREGERFHCPCVVKHTGCLILPSLCAASLILENPISSRLRAGDIPLAGMSSGGLVYMRDSFAKLFAVKNGSGSGFVPTQNRVEFYSKFLRA